MEQLSFLTESNRKERIVNVASVPLRSPFRYPGGKTWLVPRLRQWLSSLEIKPREFLEPFAGGGIISLTVAFEKLADHVTMVELDDEMAAAWETILDGNGEWLANQILHFDLSRESVLNELQRAPETTRQKAFQTILKNRTYHGGILAPGSGLLRNGENGKGIQSRWYPKTLQKRILAIEAVAENITFLHGDGIQSLKEIKDAERTVAFIDPPYTVPGKGKRAGKRLYKYCELDHEALFLACSELSGDFLMTYDNAEEVKDLAIKFGFDFREVSMKGTHHNEMKELLVGRNLRWVR